MHARQTLSQLRLAGRSRSAVAAVTAIGILGATAIGLNGALSSADAATVSAKNYEIGNLVAADLFERNVADGLGTANTGGKYGDLRNGASLSVHNGAAHLDGVSLGKSTAFWLPAVNVADVNQETTLRMDTVPSGRMGLYFATESRRQSNGDAYRAKAVVETGGSVRLSASRVRGGIETPLGSTNTNLKLSTNSKWHVEARVAGTNPVQILERVWIDGAAKPDWQLSLVDSTNAAINSAGAVGNWTYFSTTGSTQGFAVTDIRAWALKAPVTATTAPPTTKPTTKKAPTTSTTKPSTPPTTKPPTSPTTAKPTTTTTKLPAPPSTTPQKPNASNTGVPAGTKLTAYNGPSTITQDNTVIDGKEVYVDLKVAAKNVVIRNSYLHCGAGIPSNNTGCVDANSLDNYNLLVENNTIIPDHPSYYRDGIVGHEYTARGNHIAHTNDGLGIFNNPRGDLIANVVAERNYIHDLTHWNVDPAHDDGTHNDGIEIQGGHNIRVAYNNIVGSVVAGDGLGVFGLHAGAAIIVVQNTTPVQNTVIENNWLDDAQNSVCINQGKFSEVSLTLRNNLFGRNQYVYARNSTYQIRIYDKSQSHIDGLLTNRWEDTGALLTEGRDTGIRYNSE